MRFFDQVSAGNVRRTADGYLVADAKAARTGIQEYLGSELGRPEIPIVRVYRPEEEVFHKDSLSSYAHKPATNNHPDELVTAENWKRLSIGQIGDEIVRDGDHVRVPLILMDSAAIADYEKGKRDLSMGYEAEIVFQDGTTPDGQQYQAVQKAIRINHIALVDQGRASSTRIGDSRNSGVLDHAQSRHEGGHTMADNLRKVVLDGLTVETTEQGAQAIDKLQRQIADADTAKAKMISDHAAAIAAKDAELAQKDAELAKKDAEIDSTKAKVLSDADLDKRVQARADLISKAKAIHDADYTGKTDAEIRRAVVVARLGDAAIADKAEAYVDARFDILAEESGKKPDPVRQAMNDSRGKNETPDADKAYSQYLADTSNAWKGATKEAY